MLLVPALLALGAFSLGSCNLVTFSPCPNIFQYGFDKGKAVGLMVLPVPKKKVYGFNVTQVFSPVVEQVDAFPKVSLPSKVKPELVIRNILTGRRLVFVTQFPGSPTNFRLVKILLDNEPVCEEKGSQAGSKLQYRTTETFDPPTKLVSTFREFFPVTFNEPGCGELREPTAASPTFVQLSHGGEHVAWQDFPWVVAVLVSGRLACTGNLISRNLGISAAHCFDGDVNFKNVQLRLFNNETAAIWGFLQHPGHDAYELDVALIFLEKDVLDPAFVPVCLWTSDTAVDGVVGDMLGFGENEFGESGKLLRVSFPGVSKEVCRESNSELGELVQETHFCGGARDGSGPCFGDSGAGWLVQEDGKWKIRGIVSTELKDKENDGCDNFNYAILEDVSKFIPWISNTEKANVTVEKPQTKAPECGTLKNPEVTSTWAVRVYYGLSRFAVVGVLIRPDWVLVGGYALSNHALNDTQVRVKASAGLVVFAEKVLVHEKFNASNFYHNNLALVKLQTRFPETVTIFCLDSKPHGSQGLVLYSTAKGIDGTPAMTKTAEAVFFTPKECAEKSDAKDFYLEKSSESNFCVANLENTVTRLVISQQKTQDGRQFWTLGGILAVIYQEISVMVDPFYYKSWIESTIENNKT